MTEFGRPHLHLRLTDSTNERAHALAEAGAESGTIVTASEQSAGRGRHGRRWSAPPDTALLYSAILRPLEPAHKLLPLAVPVAVCEAIESLAPRACAIKWPNDVWIAERKVAGVLIEARPPDWALIGVGINLSIADDAFAPGLRWPATSVGEGIGQAEMREALSGALGLWVEAPEGVVLAAFRDRDALAGRRVSWEGGPRVGSGTAEGIDNRGNLLVDTDGGRLSLGAGEVTLRPD